MRKMRITRLLAIVLTVVMMLGLLVPGFTMNAEATQTKKANFSTAYTLTGDGATDILNVALAQVGKTGSQLGYTEEWCANFVSDCADLAGQSAAVPRTGAVNHEYTSSEKWYGLKQTILKAGGVDVGLANAQPGDIIFFSGHVEIVYSGSGSSIKSVGGNTGSGSTLYSRIVCSPRVHGSPVCVLRPNYSGGTVVPDITPPANATYFPACGSGYTSIVEALNSIGVDSSYAYRKTIAAANGINNYSGTADQNTTMLNLLKAGSLINPDASSSAIVTPTITTDKSSYTVGDTVNISWAASPSNSNLSHYWLTIIAPDGTYVYGGTMNLNTSYSFAASQAGDYAITTYATPQGSLEGEGSLTDTATITVNAPKPIEFYCSSTSFLVSTDCEDVKSREIEFWYYNYTEGVTIGFEHGENQKTICEWGEWENDSITLTVTAIEGCENGTELLTVYLKNTETGERLAEKTLSVQMLNDAVYASESAVTINKTENETKQIIFTYDCVSASSLYIHADSDSYDNVSLDWGTWSNSQLPLTLEGLSSGVDNIVFEMIDSNTEEILATTTVKVTVIENKCTVKWNSNYEGGPIRYAEYTVGDKFGTAANTNNVSRPGFIFGGWYTFDGKKITSDTLVPNEDKLTLYAQWKADGVYISIDTVKLTLDELIAADYKVKVPIRISGTGGWYELAYGASWNPDELEGYSTSDGTVIYQALMDDITVVNAPVIHNDMDLFWAGAVAIAEADGTKNYVEDGILLNITFTVNPSAAAGDEYTITALDTAPDGTRAEVSTADGNLMYYNVSSGAILIDYTPSDINQDTSISLLDAVLLQKHLLSLRSLTAEQMQLADINGDGVVNVFDMSLLKTLL